MKKNKPMSFDDLLVELKGQKTIQKDPNHISLEELFNDSFMSKHSKSKSFAEFLEKGNFQIQVQADVDYIPDELFDRHVARDTEFASWKAMLETANREYGLR